LPGKEKTKKQPLLGKIKLSKAVAEVPFEEYDKVIVSQGGWKDVVHGPFKNLFTRLNNYVLVYHNYNVQENFSPRKLSLLKQWAEKATKNLGATLKIFQALEEIHKVNIPRQERLFNPLTIDRPETITPFPPPANEKYLFAVLAALDIERKAQDILIISLSNQAWKDRNWELHLYGEGKDKSFLQKLTNRLKLQDKIFIHGNAKNYKEAICQSHLVLQMTHIDAMPITVIEAMAMARPLVVSSVGDMPLWVKENDNGWVIDNVSLENVHAGMEKAWAQRQDWESMGKRSFEFFRENFPASPVEYFLQQTGIIH
ncbi:MAG: glycosyltransferase family 4 protein, partial [Bacteroidota bacterium]